MEISVLLVTSFFLIHIAFSADACGSFSCGIGGPKVRFPFWLKDRVADRCGYPRFDLSCRNRNRTVLTLRFTSDFEVHRINYAKQLIYLGPVDHCLPNQILNFTLSGSPFSAVDSRNFTSFNCSGGSTELVLRWSLPGCRRCEAAGRTCGFKGDTGSEIGCSNLSKRGLPRTAKYGIILGAGIPGLVCFIGLACCLISKMRTLVHGRRADADSLGPEMNQGSNLVVNGLDRTTIDSYPKTVLGESGRLPKPSDGTCPICLVDYQPKDTLRTIPECNHYFHAKCIDEWLRMNATCPMCRRSPPGSLVVTPSLSASILSSSSSPSSSP